MEQQQKARSGAKQGQGQREKTPSTGESKQGQRDKASGGGGEASKQGQQGQKDKSGPSHVGASESSSTSLVPRLALFDHLPRKVNLGDVNSIEETEGTPLHPATIKLGLLYRNGVIQEDDDRVAALIAAFCNVIEDYKTPPNKNFSWDLDKHLGRQVQHLINCRQHCIGMGNLIRYIRYAISHTPPDMNEADAKGKLISLLHTFLEERIIFARDSISRVCTSAIQDGDVIVTYGSSPLVRYILLSMAAIKKFRLVIIDSRPLKSGLKTLKTLSEKVSCVYTPLSGAAAAMREATRVIIGATALLSNGAVLAAAGTAMVASLAKAQRVPVIVAAESYKFSEKNQLDAIVFNELGNELEIADPSSISTDPNNMEQQQHQKNVFLGSAESLKPSPFQVINLRYDLTPISNISVVATESGLIPPTSIPCIIREMRLDVGINDL